MIRTTPFHPRLSELNTTGLWGHWAGYLSATKYDMSAKHEYFAVRNSSGFFDSSPLYKYWVRGRDAVLVARAVDAGSSVDPASLRWSLGDGRYARGARVAHAFAGSGYRVVHLYAKDRAGNAARATRVLLVGR